MSDNHPQKWHLRAWRRHRGLTLAQVADRYGCDPSDISKWERGERRLNLDVLNDLAQILDVEPWWLLHVDPDDPSNDLRLLEVLRLLPPEKKDDAYRILRALADPPEAPTDEREAPSTAPSTVTVRHRRRGRG